jgi:hypothetical protein
MPHVFSPQCNQADDVMRPMNPADGGEGYSAMQHQFFLGETGNEGYAPLQHQFFLQGIDEDPIPIVSPMIPSGGTPVVDILTGSQFATPALNGGLGAVQDALSVLAVVDLLSR